MATLAVLRTVLFFRMLNLLALAASAVLMGLNNFKNDDASKIMFTDLKAYRYVFAASAIGFLYTLIQIPFAIYNVVQGKRWIRYGCLKEFDFYGDKVIAFLLASGVGVGFGVTFEWKRAFGEVFNDKANKFLNMGNISIGLLLAGFIFMAMLSILSSNRHSSSGDNLKRSVSMLISIGKKGVKLIGFVRVIVTHGFSMLRLQSDVEQISLEVD